jgi:hypothetical protein
MLHKISFLIAILISAPLSWAQTQVLPDAGALDVATVTLRAIPNDPRAAGPQILNDCSQLNSGPGVMDEGAIGWGDIVAIGQKVWQIVEANKPVVTTETPVAYALPRGLSCWADLQNWQPPRTQSYEVSYKNGFGMEVVKFRFRLHYTYGGGRAEGIGRYLANVTVMPADLEVLWGYTFNASVEVGQAVNLGTLDNPTAGLELNVKWGVKTVIKESQNSFHFFVQGDGVTQTAE